MLNYPYNRARNLWLATMGLPPDATKAQRIAGRERLIANVKAQLAARQPRSRVQVELDRIAKMRREMGV
jgi:hypothetical protein